MKQKTINSINKKNIVPVLTILLILATITAVSCSSVFSAGVSGRVVNSESTNSPKDGIPDVSVFAYVNIEARDADFVAWTNGTRFSPATTEFYIGQTSTNNEGEFTINKIVWESFSPEFGKTADFTTIYLLFYHENFGLVKNTDNAVVISDSTSSVIYQEMTSVRKSTSLEIQIRDASSDAVLNTPINVSVSVPQVSGTTEYEISVNGNSTLSIIYPRYESDGKTPLTPEIKIIYSQLGSDIDYIACNYDEENNKYAFIENSSVSKTVSGSTYPVRLYMKSLTLPMSSIGGQINYGTPEAGSFDEGTVADDNIIIMLAYTSEGKYVQYPDISASVRTTSSGDGANSSLIRHGIFSQLGQDITWKNTTYEGTYDTKTIYIIVDKDGDEKISEGDFCYKKTIRSDEANLNVGILNNTTHTLVEEGQL